MKAFICTGLAGALLALPAAADEERRELGPHEHGHGSLNIAIEGGKVFMELDVPGADIVGFEHVAETEDDKAMVAAAEAKLKRPLEVFVMPARAGCATEDANVVVVREHHDEHDADAEEGHNAAGEDEDGAHSEFHAEYVLSCAATGEISSIEFAYFDMFAGAMELEVAMATENGQAAFEVERDDPRIDIAGLN